MSDEEDLIENARSHAFGLRSIAAFQADALRDVSTANVSTAAAEMIETLAAALEATKPRTVTTVEELDALPARTFIREYDGFHRLKEINGMWLLCIQSGGIGESDEIELPATVLHTPDSPPATTQRQSQPLSGESDTTGATEATTATGVTQDVRGNG